MTELNQKGWQEAYKKQIELAHTTNTAELKEADDMGKDMKKNLLLQSLSTEEIKQQEAEIEESTLQQKLQANEKYLKSYKFFTDEIANLKDKEGKGVYGKEEDKDTFESKSTKDLAKIEEEVRGNRRQLGIADAEETNRANALARGNSLEAAKEKVGDAQWEYDNLKKLNDLKIGLNLATPIEAFESELILQKQLLKAKRDAIILEQGQPQTASKRAQLASDLIKVNNELNDSEKTKYELVRQGIQTDEIKQKKLEALVSAEIAYSQIVGDPSLVESLSKRLEISKLSFAADIAQRENLPELAAAYRKTAAALSELNSGPAIFVGFKTALRDMTNEIGSATKQWTELFKGVFDDLKTSLSSGFVDLWKGNINLGKAGDLDNVKKQLSWNDAEREKLELQKKDIENNETLGEAEKKQGTAAIDLKLKELDANKQLLEKQQDAINNSKSAADLFQGFLDKLTQKIADFLASSIVMEFIAFLSGKSFGSSALGGLFGLGTSATGGGDKGGGGTGGIGGILGAGSKIYQLYNRVSGWFGGSPEIADMGGSIAEWGGEGTGAVEAFSGGTGVELSEVGLSALEASSGATSAVTTVELSEAGLAALEASSGGAAAGAGGAAAGTQLGGAALVGAWGGFAVGAATAMYMAYQSMTRDLVGPALRQMKGSVSNLAAIGGNRPEMANDEMGRGVMDLFGKMSDQEKTSYIAEQIKNMELYREDSKLTEAQIKQLITNSLGPMNQEVLKAAEAFQTLNDVSRFTEAGLKLDAKTIADLKTQFAGMDQKTIESIPNLQAYGQILEQMGINFGTFNSETINAAIVTGQLKDAMQDMATGMDKADPTGFAELLNKMKNELSGTGSSLLGLIPNLSDFWVILERIGITLNQLPTDKTVNLDLNTNKPTSGENPSTLHSGGFLGKFHAGGFIKYHPFGGALKSDEVPFIGQKGEYVLSKNDVEFIKKVKGGGVGSTEIINMPAILPRINVLVNNQSAAQVASAGAIRYSDDEYIIDVLLKDIHSNGRLRNALSFG